MSDIFLSGGAASVADILLSDPTGSASAADSTRVADQDIALYSYRPRGARQRVRTRQDDDDEVFSVVLAVLDQVPTGRR